MILLYYPFETTVIFVKLSLFGCCNSYILKLSVYLKDELTFWEKHSLSSRLLDFILGQSDAQIPIFLSNFWFFLLPSFLKQCVWIFSFNLGKSPTCLWQSLCAQVTPGLLWWPRKVGLQSFNRLPAPHPWERPGQWAQFTCRRLLRLVIH